MSLPDVRHFPDPQEPLDHFAWDRILAISVLFHEFVSGNLMGVLAFNLLPMFRQFYLLGEEFFRSTVWLITRLVKVGAKVTYHGRR
jgi:hypothetical protein